MLPKIKSRSVPYSLREAIEPDLKWLQQLGLIEKVNHSDWAAPIAPVPKEDQSVRICGDFKLTVNPVLQVDQFPLPNMHNTKSMPIGNSQLSKIGHESYLLHYTVTSME